jgi:hypothetical protein
MLSDVLKDSGTARTGTGSLVTTSILLPVSVTVPPSDLFLCFRICLLGGFSELLPLEMDCPTMVTVGRGADRSSDCSSRSSPIVAALYAMS